MSKQELIHLIDETLINIHNYNWTLYLFKLDKRSKENPYFVYKLSFKNDDYFPAYVENLLHAIKKYQIDSLDRVEEYNGENTKVSCDKLPLSDLEIKDAWEKFACRIGNASQEKVRGKIAGYVVSGRPAISAEDSLKPVIFVKFGNPIVSLNTKRFALYRQSPLDNNLDMFNDEIYRLYLQSDIIIHDNNLYAFNHAFEPFFDMAKTMDVIKEGAIERISEKTGAFSDLEQLKHFAKSYKSSRTFLTLAESRLAELNDEQGRADISRKLRLKLDGSGKIIVDNEEEASLLIRYLCYKIIEENRTNKILEVSNAKEIL